MTGAGGQTVWDRAFARSGDRAHRPLQGRGRGQEVARQGDGDPDGGGAEGGAKTDGASPLPPSPSRAIRNTPTDSTKRSAGGIPAGESTTSVTVPTTLTVDIAIATAKTRIIHSR